MKIKYIIDYKGYGNFYQLTNTRNGECLDITKEEAKGYFDESTTYLSVRAEVSLKSVDQVEVPSTGARWYDPTGRIANGTVI
tara:strand:- start:1238 stop:1483 length:246 start_codon:yes stop_codon:yes gene_type:complete